MTSSPIYRWKHCWKKRTNHHVGVIVSANKNFLLLTEMLPQVLGSLKTAGQLSTQMKFNQLLADNKIPMTNIAYLLFPDVVEWHRSCLDGTDLAN